MKVSLKEIKGGYNTSLRSGFQLEFCRSDN